MSHNRQVAEEFLAALQRLDTTSLPDLLTEDVVEVLPLAASGRREPAAQFDGRDAVMDVQNTIVSAFSTVLFVDPLITESEDGQTVFVESFGRRVQAGTGRVYENVYVLKFQFRDGRICRITEYSNPVAFATFFDQPIG